MDSGFAPLARPGMTVSPLRLQRSEQLVSLFRLGILVDDGIATGASVTAGVRTLRQMQPAAIVIAAPVVPLAAVNRLRREVDDVVCAEIPETFFGVGQFYDDFSQVSDAEVNELLKTSFRQHTEPQGRNVGSIMRR